MRRLLSMTLGITLSGCGGDGGSSSGLPDAGPDLLPGVVEGPDDCGPYAHYLLGQTRTWVGRFGQGTFETTTTVDSLDADGMVTETLLSGNPNDFHGEGTNHYQCDQDGLRTVDTSFSYLSATGQVFFDQTLEYDPPILRARRSLALGDTWEESPTRYTYSSNGDSVDDLDIEYRVVAEQIAATGAGSWPALLVEGWDQYSGTLAERDWRVEGVGDVIFATYQGGVPGFAQELVSIEIPSQDP